MRAATFERTSRGRGGCSMLCARKSVVVLFPPPAKYVVNTHMPPLAGDLRLKRPPLSARRCPGRGGLGGNEARTCFGFVVLFPAIHTTYTNARHASPRPARKQGLAPPPPPRLCIPRRPSAFPLPHPGLRRQPQLRPGPRARAHTCAQLRRQRIRRHSYPHGACPASADHAASADLIIGHTSQPHTPYRPPPPPAAA